MNAAAPAGPIPVNEPLLDGNEEKYLLECIRTGWISSEGPFVRRFEEAFAARVGRQHGVAVANGSGALDVAGTAPRHRGGGGGNLPPPPHLFFPPPVLRAGGEPGAVGLGPPNR